MHLSRVQLSISPRSRSPQLFPYAAYTSYAIRAASPNLYAVHASINVPFPPAIHRISIAVARMVPPMSVPNGTALVAKVHLQQLHFTCRRLRKDTDNWFGRRVLKPRESLRAKGVGDLIRVTCIDQTFDLIRSEDLTWAKLQIEVSLLLGCNPRKLEFVANEMDLEMIMEFGVIVPTARKTRASQIHFNYMRNSGSEDEDMEDVS
jgi:hypothetical protein